MTRIFFGPLIQTNDKEELIIKENVAVFVHDGEIFQILENLKICEREYQFKRNCGEDFGVKVLSHGQFMVPGFIDAHTHAVQFPNLGLGYNKGLLDWLEAYTFPLEKKYSDTEFAERVFEAVVKRTIKMGTTTACYFASLYADACVILAKKTAELGQRAFIGKVNMNIPRDDGYCESTLTSVADTVDFIKSIEIIGNPLVKPIITPRFALSCDMELMQQLAEIAKTKDIHIQSHVSENKDEIMTVKRTFPHLPSYTAVYDAAGLLTNKTVLAHGVYLEDSELAILKERGTAVIHCPSSNINLKSGLCDVQRLKANGIKVGLGTDASGAASCSMLNEMRSVLQVSNCLSLTRDNYTPLNYKDVFHMATLGGAKALAIDDKIGNLMEGKEFDALIVDMNAEGSLLDNFKEYTLEENFQRFIYAGDERNIVSVYVKGKQVK
ncbi:Guanine deaminase [Trachymyrmex septentrionalis]|uniref:Guanine deaminase n=1 Tax=Trachymyrmex septentrionalis TaxID=34720 RepID=A0A195FCJ6_9HYME|nr:PREDICTED: guanine deaminase [Trachymyrmex septentrionalis]XP_018343758.1 PREDICTED: guanine deaminase [Trachymyrmex septentrionalis]KYN38360.1 Guanine deaminase [Trachymyrmex septentrionalis]